MRLTMHALARRSSCMRFGFFCQFDWRIYYFCTLVLSGCKMNLPLPRLFQSSSCWIFFLLQVHLESFSNVDKGTSFVRKRSFFRLTPTFGRIICFLGRGATSLENPTCPNDEKMQPCVCLMLMRIDLLKVKD